MSGEEHSFQILQHVSLAIPTMPTNSMKNSESLMTVSQFPETEKKIFHKYLSDLPTPSPNYKPLEQKLLKRTNVLPQTNRLVIEENLING